MATTNETTTNDDQERFAPQVEATLKTLRDRYPSTLPYNLGEEFILEKHITFLPCLATHKSVPLRECCQPPADVFSTVRGRANVISLLRKGSRVKVLEFQEEDISSFSLDNPSFAQTWVYRD